MSSSAAAAAVPVTGSLITWHGFLLEAGEMLQVKTYLPWLDRPIVC